MPKLAKSDRIFTNFAKFLSNLRISVNFLGFPGIPTNFREILSEKELISADHFRKILQKSREFTEFFQNKIAKILKILNLERCKGL